MAIDSNEIRNEIIRILEEYGSHRSKRLADEVVKKVGSEKTVYREIKAMAESGEIRKTGSGQHISYDLPSVTERNELVLLKLLEYAENNNEYLIRTQKEIAHKKQLFHIMVLGDIVFGIKQLQTIETRFRILKMFGALRKLEYFKKLEKQIEKNWRIIWSLIALDVARSKKSDIVGEVLMNFQPVMRGFMMSVGKDKHEPVKAQKQGSKSAL